MSTIQSQLRMRTSHKQHGFTLVELLVVVVILVVLAAIAIPLYLNQTAKAKDARAQSNISTSAGIAATAGQTLGSATYDPSTRELVANFGLTTGASTSAGKGSRTLAASEKVFSGGHEVTGSSAVPLNLSDYCFQDTGQSSFHMGTVDLSPKEGGCVASSSGTASTYNPGTESYGFSSGAGRNDFSLAMINIDPAISPDAAAALTNGGATFTITQGGTPHYVGPLTCSHELPPFTTSVACVNGDISTSGSYVPMDPGVATVTFTVGSSTYTVAGDVPIY